ncbi:hypothetical protein GGU10DRAFT_432748 [Lentinula aff. detonsa]|uniref:RING-type domain-containing protein n=1 Tax=Lentinula aff. detonsa TaxID=2804958 RepID=A0AA38KHM5_9AGAR|nr:hypothetical protein GGU10DRAFT_432748 [Lentinula aff. detonsa]
MNGKSKDKDDRDQKRVRLMDRKNKRPGKVNLYYPKTLTLPSEPEPHLRESSTYPNPISPKPLPDLLCTQFLSTYICPICFSPPTNATITPCGHVACGPCLFTAVKTALRRESMMMGGAMRDEGGSRCLICRALIQGWDGQGGGVVWMVVQVVVTA